MFPVGTEYPEFILPIIPKNYMYTNGNYYTDSNDNFVFTEIRKNTFVNWLQINKAIK
jgi:hypothetical protein